MRRFWMALVLGLCGATPAYSDTAVVNTPGDGFLALRSEPSTKQGVRLVKIPHGTVLDLGECVRPSANQRWCKTSHAGQAGWVLDAYVVRIEDGDAGQTDAEERAILNALRAVCTPDWCVPAVEQVVDRYATATLRCTLPACENATAYLIRQGGTWVVVDYGTGITEEDLIESGFPPSVARMFTW